MAGVGGYTEKERVLAETRHTINLHREGESSCRNATHINTPSVFCLLVCLFGWLVGWLVVVFAVAAAAVAAVAVAVGVGVVVVVVAVAQQKPVILDALPLASAGVGG